MKKSTIFLQFMTTLIAIGALAFLIFEPQREGVNIGKPLVDIYFKDPFLAYAYIASIPFFVALYNIFRILGNIRHDTLFSPHTLIALNTIQRAALAMVGFVIGGVLWLVIQGVEENPPVVFMALLITLLSGTLASGATILKHIVTEKLG